MKLVNRETVVGGISRTNCVNNILMVAIVVGLLVACEKATTGKIIANAEALEESTDEILADSDDGAEDGHDGHDIVKVPDIDTGRLGDACIEAIDLVFVVDVSTTMGYILETLHDEIAAVWDACMEIDENTRFGLVVFVDDVLVVNDGIHYSDLHDIQSDFYDWYTHTATNRQITSQNMNADMPENSLDALVEAAKEVSWRPGDDVIRIIIHVTDDTFREAPEQFIGSVTAMHTYTETITTLQEKEIRVASFASMDSAEGWFESYQGQPSIPEATSGAVYDIADVGIELSLSVAISDFVASQRCEVYEPVLIE